MRARTRGHVHAGEASAPGTLHSLDKAPNRLRSLTRRHCLVVAQCQSAPRGDFGRRRSGFRSWTAACGAFDEPTRSKHCNDNWPSGRFPRLVPSGMRASPHFSRGHHLGTSTRQSLTWTRSAARRTGSTGVLIILTALTSTRTPSSACSGRSHRWPMTYRSAPIARQIVGTSPITRLMALGTPSLRRHF